MCLFISKYELKTLIFQVYQFTKFFILPSSVTYTFHYFAQSIINNTAHSYTTQLTTSTRQLIMTTSTTKEAITHTDQIGSRHLIILNFPLYIFYLYLKQGRLLWIYN
jgi:hypothetical protein